MKNKKIFFVLSLVLAFVLTVGVVQNSSVEAGGGTDNLTDTGQSACFNADGETIDCPA